MMSGTCEKTSFMFVHYGRANDGAEGRSIPSGGYETEGDFSECAGDLDEHFGV